MPSSLRLPSWKLGKIEQQEKAMLDGDEKKYFEQIMAAIKAKDALSFNYAREDGQITTHNAVYPRQLFRRGNQFYFRAYCHFPRDIRLFRLDRLKSLEVVPKREPLTRRQVILGVLLAIGLGMIVFVLGLLFSPKYQWRKLRRFIFSTLGIQASK